MRIHKENGQKGEGRKEGRKEGGADRRGRGGRIRKGNGINPTLPRLRWFSSSSSSSSSSSALYSLFLPCAATEVFSRKDRERKEAAEKTGRRRNKGECGRRGGGGRKKEGILSRKTVIEIICIQER